jgi:hypothetical protein
LVEIWPLPPDYCFGCIHVVYWLNRSELHFYR